MCSHYRWEGLGWGGCLEFPQLSLNVFNMPVLQRAVHLWSFVHSTNVYQAVFHKFPMLGIKLKDRKICSWWRPGEGESWACVVVLSVGERRASYYKSHVPSLRVTKTIRDRKQIGGHISELWTHTNVGLNPKPRLASSVTWIL